MKLTAKEIIEKIVAAGISEENFGYGDLLNDELKFDFSPIQDQIDGAARISDIPYKERKAQYPEWDYGTDSKYAIMQDYFLKTSGIGSFKEIEQVGGEGEGSHWHSVKYFKDHDVYIKTTGHYTSYHGTDFDYGYGEEVTPQEKTITVYE